MINLKDTQLFKDIEENNILFLLQCLGAKTVNYKKGSIILCEGEIVEQVGLVLSGKVLLEISDLVGNTSVINDVEQGDIFGETYACIGNEKLIMDVVAASDCQILFLNIKSIVQTCEHNCCFHVQLIRNLLRISATKSLILSRRVAHTTPKSIRARLISYLSECQKREGKNYFEIPYDRQQLANYLNVDRSAMSNELSKMRDEGLITYRKSSFIIEKM